MQKTGLPEILVISKSKINGVIDGRTKLGLQNMSEAIMPGYYDPSSLDDKINVMDDDAFQTSRSLAPEEGLFAGMNSGAALWIALERQKN